MIVANFEIFGREYAQPPILDGLSTAKIAFSLRKVRTTYTGYCLKVRRSSDNAEQDIGFVGGIIDTTSLLTFVGSGNGFVTKWYDQSGSGNDAVQATSANQPYIVESGNLILENTKLTVKFIPPCFMTFPSFTTPAFSVYTVHSYKTSSPAYMAIVRVIPTSGDGFMVGEDYGYPGTDSLIHFLNGNSMLNGTTGSAYAVVLPTPLRSLIWHNDGDKTAFYGTSHSEAYTQGVSMSEQTGYSGGWGSYTTSGLNIGYGNNNGYMSISEVLIWNTDERGSNNLIMEDLRQYYTLY